ncbi:MAG TPA: hypothetical protein VL463_28895 [Kofleriaceae bacterium]|nr:hypothetical protein [Kofleriaceae bacterium]
MLLGGGAIALAAWRGVLAPAYLTSLSTTACFLVGLVASLAAGLALGGWRPHVASRGAMTFGRSGLVLVDDPPRVRELPAVVQRALVLAAMTCVTLLALGNHAAARIVELPADLAAPEPSGYCMPRAAAAKEQARAPAPVVDQAGCALVKRAYQLGYTKSLGSCAPKEAAPVVTAVAQPQEVCTRRQLDEPWLHYGYRKASGAFGALGDVAPGDAIDHRVTDVRAHLDHLESLLANVASSIGGSPHAAHHLWIALPDPHGHPWTERFTGEPRCSTVFASLPLWPRDLDRSQLVEHVIGQLLFATRFGTTASCNDLVIHWDAPADACARLEHDPVAFLGEQHALASVRAVLARRRRAIELRGLTAELGRRVPPEPPPAQAIVSLSCFVAGEAKAAHGSMVSIDGDAIGVREVGVKDIRTAGAGPIDVYVAMASLLAGISARPALAQAEDVDPNADDFLLTRLDPLVDADPFAGARWPLERDELIEIVPIERHLHAFIDDFRRRYLAQRGRL